MELSPKLQACGQQRQILTQGMQQSLQILQLSQLELGALIQEEIDSNPLLEVDSEPFSRISPGERPLIPDIEARPTLRGHLSAQVKEVFPCPFECYRAEQLIDKLDERGLLIEPIDPIDEPILSILQTLDPPGIFARSCQEAFLVQLERSGQKESLAFQLVLRSFDDLLHARYGKMEKTLGCSPEELSEAIQKLARLTTRPASQFLPEPTQPIYPDLRIVKVDQNWVITPLEEALPKFHLNTDYLNLEGIPKEQKETVNGFAASGKWLLRSIERRRHLLHSIGAYLAKNQTAYLDNTGPLVPICPADLATLFGVHESTISRALADKYISSPRGMIPMRSLISSHGNDTAKQLLQQLIARENKEAPLTDDQIADELCKSGHPVARRTVAKYRTQLKISPATTRKHFNV